jgi:N-acetylmuramoyl-L-alanine amidase
LLLLLLPAVPAYARHKSEAWARSQFASSARLQEALDGRPVEDRTRREYQRVINNYRAVYSSAPTSTKADPSVVAVAELMVEMGRHFHDDAILRSAIGQYEFLRREYPGSKYRFQALFTVGEIYKEDLNQPAKAREVFAEFVRRYPRNQLATQARQALDEPAQPAGLKSRADTSSNDSDDSSEDKPKTASANHQTDSGAEAIDAKPARVTGIRHWSTPDYTRVAIDLEQEVQYESQRINHPDRIFFDLLDARLASTLVGKTFDVEDGFLKKIRVAQFQPGKARIVLEVDELADYNAFLLPNPARLIVDIHGQKGAHPLLSASGGAASQPSDEMADAPSQSGKAPAVRRTVTSNGVKKTVVEAGDDDDSVTTLDPPEIKPVVKPLPAPVSQDSPRNRATNKSKRKSNAATLDVHEAQPTASGDRSLIRALGLKIGKIVIDPGHGGHDTGTIGPNGLEEKDLVLEVGRRLGKLLEARLGAEVVYTRSDDTFIPLETRTAIANQEQADLFVSIHANSSRDPDARGVETYYLNFTSSPEALEVAARENAVSDKSIHELQDLVKKIALKEKIDESREFAADVQTALHSGLASKSPGIRDRGVKKAPFIVLIGANMPSILAEISFVSNPGDERRLETSDYRQRIAESLYRGISKYVSGLSGVKVASKIDKSARQ